QPSCRIAMRCRWCSCFDSAVDARSTSAAPRANRRVRRAARPRLTPGSFQVSIPSPLSVEGRALEGWAAWYDRHTARVNRAVECRRVGWAAPSADWHESGGGDARVPRIWAGRGGRAEAVEAELRSGRPYWRLRERLVV